MSDLRGLSRGSKTAAVVIVGVLLQVIVVALLGLSAITRDREAGVRDARDDAARRAGVTARDAAKRASRGVESAISAVASAARGPGGLRNLAREGWIEAFRDVYRVDALGRVYSGDKRLYVPPGVVEQARVDPLELDLRLRRLAELPHGTEAGVVDQRRQFVADFPFYVDADRWAHAVGQSLALAEDLAAEPTSRREDVEQEILRAYETAALNDGRPGATRPEMGYVEARLDAAVRRRPAAEREALLEALGRLRAARAGLRVLREYALKDAQDAATREAPPRVFTRGGELVAVAPLPRVAGAEPEALLVRLDPGVLMKHATALVTEHEAKDGRLEFQVVPRDWPSAPDPLATRVPVQEGTIDLGIDAIATPVGPVVTGRAATGPRESFYWAILALAAMGVATAGIVLWRILRREVHLARLKADFVSNLSHELKTPLTSISMFVEMMRDGSLTDGPELQEGVAVIGQETDRLQRIVGRMIDVARREAGASGYDLVVGDLNAPVRAACERFRRLEKAPGLRLELSLSPALPRVRLDAGAIDDVVTNLLSNAWKYRKGERALVRVSTAPTRRGAEIVVTDDGIGIPVRERKKVFETFYRAESYLTRTVPGTGLGLALVRTIVREPKGKVRVEGAPDLHERAEGGGTTFRLTFPKARGAAAPAAPRPSSPAGTSSPPAVPAPPPAAVVKTPGAPRR